MSVAAAVGWTVCEEGLCGVCAEAKSSELCEESTVCAVSPVNQKSIVNQELVVVGEEISFEDAKCTLQQAEMGERVGSLNRVVDELAREIKKIEGGYALRFDPTKDNIQELSQWIIAESQCCAFLKFVLILEPNGGPLWFEVTGNKSAQDMLRSFLGRSDS